MLLNPHIPRKTFEGGAHFRYQDLFHRLLHILASTSMARIGNEGVYFQSDDKEELESAVRKETRNRLIISEGISQCLNTVKALNNSLERSVSYRSGKSGGKGEKERRKQGRVMLKFTSEGRRFIKNYLNNKQKLKAFLPMMLKPKEENNRNSSKNFFVYKRNNDSTKDIKDNNAFQTMYTKLYNNPYSITRSRILQQIKLIKDLENKALTNNNNNSDGKNKPRLSVKNNSNKLFDSSSEQKLSHQRNKGKDKLSNLSSTLTKFNTINIQNDTGTIINQSSPKIDLLKLKHSFYSFLSKNFSLEKSKNKKLSSVLMTLSQDKAEKSEEKRRNFNVKNYFKNFFYDEKAYKERLRESRNKKIFKVEKYAKIWRSKIKTKLPTIKMNKIACDNEGEIGEENENN